MKAAANVLAQLNAMPHQPGIYQYRDQAGNLLYVGKAKDLKNRVSNYFQNNAQHSPRIAAMVSQIANIQIVVTQSEIEALVLEANLIKTHRPKYNIVMRDDKKYPWLVLTNEPFPRLVYSRGPSQKNRERSFGPYPSAGALYQTMQVLKKIFPLRQRRKPLFTNRPCMNYFIGTCLGPCQKLISPEAYQGIVDQLILFLRGQADDLLASVSQEMQAASEALDFERAAKLRDRYAAIETIIQQQRVMSQDESLSQDVLGLAFGDLTAYGVALKIRKGRLIQTQYFEIPLQADISESEAYRSFVLQYYENITTPSNLPEEVVLQMHIDDETTVTQWLSEKRKKSVKVFIPKRKGQRQDILDFALKNAQEARERGKIEAASKLRHDPAQALFTLQEKLKLPEVPRRIECYDISHIQGTNTVASMVVFTDGLSDKAEYRRFKIQSTQEGTPNDFQSMAEVMARRFTNRDAKGWPDPDLIIIDGGKGQLSAAKEALEKLGITDQSIVSLAKKFEEVFLPEQSRPILLERDSMAMFLVQQIRDEAHRFAITFHRKLRGKAQTKGPLDELKGLGETRKQRLLVHFGSTKAMKAASLEDIARVTQTQGKTAEKIYTALQSL